MTNRDLEKKAQELSRIVDKSQKRVIAHILSSDSYSLLEKERILRQIDKELRDLVGDSNTWFARNVRSAYKEGSSDVIGYLKNLGIKRVIFTQLDSDSIQNMAYNSQRLFAEAVSGIGRSSSNILHKATKARLQAKIKEGRLNNETLKQISNGVAGYLKDQGVYLLDSAGRKWEASAYSNMFARTELMNVYNQGVVNQMLHHNQDLAYVTSYASCKCEVCQSWEGKVLSLTGATKGYPTLDQAYNDGLFHPKCKHRMRPYVQSGGEYSDGNGKITISLAR